MNWTWVWPGTIDDPDLVADLSEGWPSQEEAESWLREVYADLADQDIESVTLTCDGESVYSMSLLED